MIVTMILNGKKITDEIAADMTLFDFVRKHGCYSVTVSYTHLDVYKRQVNYYLRLGSLSLAIYFAL